jgi:hypothetical protein
MTTERSAANYRGDLGDGLVLRWSSADDADGVAQLMGMVWRDSAEAPPNPRMIEVARRHLRGGYPLLGPGDTALVEAAALPGKPIVACASLWREDWSYEGIPFQVGRPENVAADPAYRNRGLVRAMIELLHARSTAEGHLVQAITGIPTFYRQFGYEYALDLHGRRIAYVAQIPPAGPAGAETYALRPATPADIPQVMELYGRHKAESIVWNCIPERYWRYLIDVWGDPAAPHDPLQMGVGERLHMFVDAAGNICGYASLAAKRWGSDLQVYALELAAEVSAAAAAPAILRALQCYGEQLPSVAKPPPLREINFYWGRAHPLNAVLAPALAPVTEPPYAWYIRVPDLPAWLRLIAPTLEQRLAASPVAGYSGALTLDFYRGGLRLLFERGRIQAIEPWNAPAYGANPDAGFPTLVFLQLVFGYRSLADLRYAFADVSANGIAEPLLNALFPARPSWVMPL